MRFLTTLALAAGICPSALAQAPKASSLWDIPATTLATPPALETGATAAFWNPAATFRSRGLAIGGQVIQTPEQLGLRGLIAGVSGSLTPHLAVGIVFGRVEVGDLIRTSSSPIAEAGDIPVYEQAGGAAVAARIGPADVGVLVRAHDARFDVFRQAGLSGDLGVSVALPMGFRVAATSRFQSFQPKIQAPAQYDAAIGYQSPTQSAWGTPVRAGLRYGLHAAPHASLEHTVGMGIEIISRLRTDLALVREASFHDVLWRVVLGISIQAGPYSIIAARSSGLSGLGANYRVGLDVTFD